MQWDELVLGSVAVRSTWMIFRRIRLMDRIPARPWWPPLIGSLCFAVTQFLAGLFPGPAFDGFGIDDVILFVGAISPLITCALLARRVIRTRWTALVVDGLLVTISVLVITEMLRTPLDNPVGAPEDLRSLVLAYGGYAAVMLAAATVQATATACEAMAIMAPSPLWTAASDVSPVGLSMGQSLYALLARISFDLVWVDVAGLAARDDTERALQVLASIVRTTGSFGLTTIAGGINAPQVRDKQPAFPRKSGLLFPGKAGEGAGEY